MVRLPSSWIIFSCLLLFGFGELAGALLGGYPQQIKGFIGQSAMAYPEVHGLVGIADIDRAILNGIEGEALSRVHTFHLHSHGLALVVFVLNLIIVNMGLQDRTKRILHGLTCLGLLYPFGWLMVVLTLPSYGKSGAFRLAEKFFFIPFGGVFLLAVWVLILFYFIRIIILRHEKIMFIFIIGISVTALTTQFAMAETLGFQTIRKAYESGIKTCKRMEREYGNMKGQHGLMFKEWQKKTLSLLEEDEKLLASCKDAILTFKNLVEKIEESNRNKPTSEKDEESYLVTEYEKVQKIMEEINLRHKALREKHDESFHEMMGH